MGRDSVRAKNRRSLGWLLCAMLVGFASCSGGGESLVTGSVEGTVTYNGAPLPGGTITFHGGTGHGASAAIGSDGSFSVVSQHGPGLPVGDYNVSVFIPEEEDVDPLAPESERQAAQLDIKLPRKYRDPGTSGLAASIQQNSNRLSFDLED